MRLLEIKQTSLLNEAIEVFEREEASNTIRNAVQQLPKFPGTQMKKEIDALILSSAGLLKDFAGKARNFADDHGYRTQIFDTILDNPEKIAKMLIRKYVSAYKDDAFAFSIKDLLKGVNLDIES